MGMTYRLRRATDAQLRMLQERPAMIEQFLFYDEMQERTDATGLSEMLSAKFAFHRIVSPIAVPREEGGEIMLDKAWHGIHFVLTGSADPTGEPLSLLLEDWPKIGDIQVGWEPAFAIGAYAMADFSRAFASVDVDEMRARYSPSRMAADEIYLGEFFERDGDEAFGYIARWAEELRIFAAACADRNCGAVGYIT